MKEQYERSAMLIGEEGIARLRNAHVAVFGVGGVGGGAVEALARAGIGKFTLVDADVVSESNINRQLIALHRTVGQPKVEVAAARIGEIDPDTVVETRALFFLPENADAFDFSAFDYVVDAVDTVKAKLGLALECKEKNVPLVSAMGCGNKLDATAFRVADIQDTRGCPLCRVMRRELKLHGIEQLRVVYSEEAPRTPVGVEDRRTPASVSYVPGVAGLILAGEVIKDITGVR